MQTQHRPKSITRHEASNRNKASGGERKSEKKGHGGARPVTRAQSLPTIPEERRLHEKLAHLQNESSDEEDTTPKRPPFLKNKRDLYKTEICHNWMRTKTCNYGAKCHYAHGESDMRARGRLETYKTQPCADPARTGCNVCLYGSRCNYAHPGEAIRRLGPMPGQTYLDQAYFNSLHKDFGQMVFPFGVFC